MGNGWAYDPAGQEWYRQVIPPPGSLTPPNDGIIFVDGYSFYVDGPTGNLNIKAPNGSTMTLVNA